MATTGEVQALLRFLSQDAKVPLPVAISKIKDLQKAVLTSYAVTQLTSSPVEVLITSTVQTPWQKRTCRPFKQYLLMKNGQNKSSAQRSGLRKRGHQQTLRQSHQPNARRQLYQESKVHQQLLKTHSLFPKPPLTKRI